MQQAPTMIIPEGADIQVDVHGQLSISTPGNLVIQSSGNYRILESLNGSIRIEPSAAVEAVEVRCASTCYIEGTLTAWRVQAREIHLEDDATANIVLQQTDRLEIGREARIVGNFESEKELFLLLSRFARQLRSLPLFAELSSRELKELPAERRTDGEGATASAPPPGDGTPERPAGARRGRQAQNLPDPLFYALVLLERELARSAYGPTSQRAIEELVKLLQEPDVETLALTYKGLFNRIVDPGQDIRRAFELVRSASGQG